MSRIRTLSRRHNVRKSITEDEEVELENSWKLTDRSSPGSRSEPDGWDRTETSLGLRVSEKMGFDEVPSKKVRMEREGITDWLFKGDTQRTNELVAIFVFLRTKISTTTLQSILMKTRKRKKSLIGLPWDFGILCLHRCRRRKWFCYKKLKSEISFFSLPLADAWLHVPSIITNYKAHESRAIIYLLQCGFSCLFFFEGYIYVPFIISLYIFARFF